MFDSEFDLSTPKASQARAPTAFADLYEGPERASAGEKLYKGVYHFMSADGSGEDQAEFFVANLDRKLASVGAKRQPEICRRSSISNGIIA